LSSPELHAAISALGAERRRKECDPARVERLYAQITEIKTREFIEKMLSTAPPLSDEARTRLAGLFGGDDAAA
jgi:hypothetical protein